MPIRQYGSRYLQLQNKQGLKEVLNFASNDYLGLSAISADVELQAQPASRLLSGNLVALEQMEGELAEFMQKGSATILQSGFTANMGLLSCLAQKDDLILADRLVHASMIDGMRLSPAQWKRFRHADLDHLETLLKGHVKSHAAVWVVIESVFSMDGDIFPLAALLELKHKYGFYLILDEAHSFGVYGDEGRGLAQSMDLLAEIDLMTFNFSKALALQGGVILGPASLKNFLINHCRPLIYSTATPWSHLAALPMRLAELRLADAQRQHLKELCEYARELFKLPEQSWSPIVPLMIKDHVKTQQLAENLLEHGFYCPAILPPTVSKNEARLRLSINAMHQKGDIDQLYNCIQLFLK